MKIKTTEFLKSSYTKDDYPADLYPEVAFAGRSNVGKSSLINTLVNRKSLARTSSAPGKTQSINFYLVNRVLYLVDLPGYGFAKVPLQVRRKWRPMVEEYFRNRKNLCGVVVILDARVGPTPLDLSLIGWLKDLSLTAVFAMTKVDKLSKNKLSNVLDQTAQALTINPEQIIPFSALTGEGKKRLWQKILNLIGPSDS
ncbi:MAG: YihA family ribosome biogenesis GTP-binding protein [Deltaproteobacteria bacterium]|nr:YihA family ribosome biogenesis GTP-binding protein [Deltaproteobacteria bacterium]